MPSPGGVSLMGLGSSVVGVRSKPNQLLLGKGLEPNTVAPMALQAPMQQQQQQQHHLHHQQQQHQQQQQPPQQQHQHHFSDGVGDDPLSAPIASANPPISLQGMNQFGAPSCFPTGQDRLPMDLDIDMFTENLDCDVDYIINSDLMDGDGIDFNFDPILPGGQGYAGPATTQGSQAHSW
ncbi:hypothetical protein L3Q82_020486, partial [Scortum barcoo]